MADHLEGGEQLAKSPDHAVGTVSTILGRGRCHLAGSSGGYYFYETFGNWGVWSLMSIFNLVIKA